ncbi:MAG TPA: hypothetical protein EYN06_06300, partial [Myxococcales bacterium]|nr:hypothetical protein [Myxococcales bacterium]
DPGTLNVFPGVTNAWPAPAPSIVTGGLSAGNRFGMSAKLLGVDSETQATGFFVYAELTHDFGAFAGRPYWVPWDEWATLTPLDLPGKASGATIGKSVAIVGDINGDGMVDLAVGAEQETQQDPPRVVYGNVYFFMGSATGFETLAQKDTQSLMGFSEQQNAERFGRVVASAGDFNGDGLPDVAVVGANTDRKESTKLAAVSAYSVPPGGCGGELVNGGGLHIFSGNSNGSPEKQATHLYFGEISDDYFNDVAGIGDLNGDGFDDLILGHAYSKVPAYHQGGIYILYGRAPVENKVQIICTADYTLTGLHERHKLGAAVTALGDLNGDGCTEAAFGGPDEKHYKTAEGAVYILFGWGATCAYQSPHLLRLSPQMELGGVGESLAGGKDLDGDGVFDLVVGSLDYSKSVPSTGALWFVSGAYLASLTPTPLPAEATLADLPIYSLVDPQSPKSNLLPSTTAYAGFAIHMALVPGLFANGRAGVIVGSPTSGASGTQLAGAAFIYEYGSQGWDPVPRATLLGETYRVPGMIGDKVAGGMLMGKPVVVVGGYYGTPVETQLGGLGSVDQGSVYELILPVFP